MLSLYLFLPSSASSHSNVFQLTARCHEVRHNGRRYNTVSCVRLDFPAMSQISLPSPFKILISCCCGAEDHLLRSVPQERGSTVTNCDCKQHIVRDASSASDNAHAQSGAHSASRSPFSSPNLQVQLRVALGSVFQRRREQGVTVREERVTGKVERRQRAGGKCEGVTGNDSSYKR